MQISRGEHVLNQKTHLSLFPVHIWNGLYIMEEGTAVPTSGIHYQTKPCGGGYTRLADNPFVSRAANFNCASHLADLAKPALHY